MAETNPATETAVGTDPVPRLFPQFSALPPLSAAVTPMAPVSGSAPPSREGGIPAGRPFTASETDSRLPLSARPFAPITQQVLGQSPSRPSSESGRNAQRQDQSLAALRRIRRT